MKREILRAAVLSFTIPFLAALSILDANRLSAASASFTFFSVIRLSNFLANVLISEAI